MSKLVVTDNYGRVAEYVIEQERFTIGRQEGNDLVLDDKAVSGRHAAIVTILDDAFLEDLDSTNGVQVNGRAISRHPLAHGDVITLGRNTLRFAAAGREDEIDKTMVLRRPAPAADPSNAGKVVLGRLRISSGPSQGKEMPLHKALTTLGKPGVQVAAISRRADGYYLVHVSGNQPAVNGRPIGTGAFKLNGYDNIELGGTRMEFLVSA